MLFFFFSYFKLVLEEFHIDHIHPFPNSPYTNPSSVHAQLYVLFLETNQVQFVLFIYS